MDKSNNKKIQMVGIEAIKVIFENTQNWFNISVNVYCC